MKLDFRDNVYGLRPGRLFAAGVEQRGPYFLIDLQTGRAERYVKDGDRIRVRRDRAGRRYAVTEKVTLALPVRFEEHGPGGRAWQTGGEVTNGVTTLTG